MTLTPSVQALVDKKKAEAGSNTLPTDAEELVVLVHMDKIPVMGNTISYDSIVGEPHPDGVERLYPALQCTWDHPEDIPEIDPNWIPDHSTLPQMISSIMFGHNGLVVGEPGTGKTTDTHQICARIKMPYYRVNGMEGMKPSDLFGHVHLSSSATVWVDGPIMRAVRCGGLLAIDEPFKMPPGTLMGMQWLAEPARLGRSVMLYGHPDPAEVKVQAHKEMRMVLCDNSRGTGDNMDVYAATNVQDTSFINRMQYRIRKTYMDKETEMRAITHKYPWITEVCAERMVKFATLMRKAWRMSAVEMPFTFRELETWAEIIAENNGNVVEALHNAYGNLLETGDETEVYARAIDDVSFRPSSRSGLVLNTDSHIEPDPSTLGPFTVPTPVPPPVKWKS